MIYKMHFQFFDQTPQFFLESILCLEIHENALINGYQTKPKRVFECLRYDKNSFI